MADGSTGPQPTVMSTIDRSRIFSTEPAVTTRDAALQKDWGDEESGLVHDWIYVSSERIYQIVFGLPPGGWFRHSERNRTIFGADELFYVLSGTMLLANPETGDVVKVERGEAAVFHPDTWHHAYSVGSEDLRVLEYFAPPPATGASQAYARTKPYLDRSTYVRDALLGIWPEASVDAARSSTLKVVRPADTLWRIEGEDPYLPIGLLFSAPGLHVASFELLPGLSSGDRRHAGDLSVFVVDGRLEIIADRGPGAETFELDVHDAFFAPAGVRHQYRNPSDRTVRAIFAVAPTY